MVLKKRLNNFKTLGILIVAIFFALLDGKAVKAGDCCLEKSETVRSTCVASAPAQGVGFTVDESTRTAQVNVGCSLKVVACAQERIVYGEPTSGACRLPDGNGGWTGFRTRYFQTEISCTDERVLCASSGNTCKMETLAGFETESVPDEIECKRICQAKVLDLSNGGTLDPNLGFRCSFNDKIIIEDKSKLNSAQAAKAEKAKNIANGVDNKSSNGSLLADLQGDINGLNKVKNIADSPQKLIGKLVGMAMGVLGSITLLIFLYGGLTWMTGRGNSDVEVTSVKTMVWAALGICVIFASYAAVTWVLGIF